MCYCDYEPPVFYNRNFVNGRTRHRCVECLREIDPGERQEYVSGKWDRDFETFRTCIRCVDLRESMDLDCFAHGNLMNDISQADSFTDEMIAFQARRDENYRRIQSEQ